MDSLIILWHSGRSTYLLRCLHFVHRRQRHRFFFYLRFTLNNFYFVFRFHRKKAITDLSPMHSFRTTTGNRNEAITRRILRRYLQTKLERISSWLFAYTGFILGSLERVTNLLRQDVE